MWTGSLYNFSFRRCDTFIEHHRTTSSRVVKTAKRRQPSLPARAFVCELPWHHHKRWRCKKSALGFCFPDRTNICKQCKKTGPYISLHFFTTLWFSLYMSLYMSSIVSFLCQVVLSAVRSDASAIQLTGCDLRTRSGLVIQAPPQNTQRLTQPQTTNGDQHIKEDAKN